MLALLVIAAWCTGTGRFSASAWNTPSQYLDGFYGDVVATFAALKATAEGDSLPFAGKNVPQLGAPYDGDWND